MNKKRLALVLALALVALTLLACGGEQAGGGDHALVGKYKGTVIKLGEMEFPMDEFMGDTESEGDMILEITADGKVTLDGEGGAVWKADGDKLIVSDENPAEGDEADPLLEGVFSEVSDGEYHLTFAAEDMEMTMVFEKVEE